MGTFVLPNTTAPATTSRSTATAFAAARSSISASFPHRGALLLERGDALLGVLAHEDARREAHLVHERLPQRQEGALLRRLLAGADGERSVQADGIGDLARPREHLVARHHPVDEADLARALGGDPIGEQDDLHRVAPGQLPRAVDVRAAA